MAAAALQRADQLDPDLVDVGGSRSATAVVGCVGDEDGVRLATIDVWQGSDAVLKATAHIEQLIAAGRPIRELVYDPMRFESEALRLEREHGLTLVSWPQSETRMTICSERLHGLVVEQRLRHPGVAELDRRERPRQTHAARLETRQVRRGRSNRCGDRAGDGRGARQHASAAASEAARVDLICGSAIAQTGHSALVGQLAPAIRRRGVPQWR